MSAYTRATPTPCAPPRRRTMRKHTASGPRRPPGPTTLPRTSTPKVRPTPLLKATDAPVGHSGSAGPTRRCWSCGIGPARGLPARAWCAGPAERGQRNVGSGQRGDGCCKTQRKPCWPICCIPKESIPASSPRPGPLACPQAPARCPPGHAEWSKAPMGHHPKRVPMTQHLLRAPQVPMHGHRRHWHHPDPQHSGRPARHTARCARPLAGDARA